VDPALTASRESALSARERELARRERLLSARELALRELAPAVEDSELEEVEEMSALPFERALVAMALESGHHAIDEDDHVEEIEDVEEDAVASAEDDDDEDVEDVSDAVEEGEQRALPAVLLVDGDLAESELAHTVSIAPDAFETDPSMQLCLSAGAGGVWLFVRGRPAVTRDESELEFLIQLDPASEIPVVLVTLVFDSSGSPDVRRGVIDPFDPEQVQALRLLGQHFSVELVSWSPGGTLDHWATLHAPREANVRAALAVLEAHGSLDEQGWKDASGACMAAPPPWHDPSHPFQVGESPESPRTATEAAVRLDELAEWLAPERRERLRLLWCVPDETVDEHDREALAAALDWGLSLSRPLAARAIELGVARDEPALLQRRIEGLKRVSGEPDFGGLEASVLRTLWAEALEQAARLGVSLSDAARDAARLHAGEREQAHAQALVERHDDGLEILRAAVHGPQPELATLLELAREGGHRDIVDACNASVSLTPEAAAELFARLSRRSDPVALDALLSLLTTAEALRVRAGAALALSARRALNAIDELTRRVALEGEPAWGLFAAALGRYGAGSFRAITRALDDFQVSEERAVLVLARLSLHGARSQLRAKTRVEDAQEAQLAARALLLAGELKDGKNLVSGLEQQGPLTVFSELFDRSQRDVV
jgi:hypothetical protein